jgi:hypothetical protein
MRNGWSDGPGQQPDAHPGVHQGQRVAEAIHSHRDQDPGSVSSPPAAVFPLASIPLDVDAASLERHRRRIEHA